jgi:enoyl-CoA hydratase/carnithine racemase
MESEKIVVAEHLASGVALITLNRPRHLNAWTLDMEREYFEALLRCDRSPDVRAIVVTGAGRGFCAGGDIEMLVSTRDNGVDLPRDRLPGTLPLTIRKPMIAAINGACAGAGIVQALMCDVRFAAEGAKFTFAFARLGLVAEYGISWLLPRVVGMSNALDLLMSSRIFTSNEAMRVGLVKEVIPAEEVLDRAIAYASDLARNCSPTAMSIIKSQLYRHATYELDDALRETDRLVLESFGRPDFAEGVTSFVEKRLPAFSPLGDARLVSQPLEPSTVAQDR